MRLLKGYLFYYRPVVYFVNENRDEFKFEDLDFYNYFRLKLRIYSPSKTRVPAIAIEFVILGFGFEFYTHNRM